MENYENENKIEGQWRTVREIAIIIPRIVGEIEIL